MIRFPKDACPRERPGYDMPLDEVPAVFLHRSSLPGPAALLVASGPLSDAAAQAAEELEGRGIRCDALHLRFLKPLEINYLSDLFARYDAVVAAEEGVLTGSVAAELAALAAAGGRRSRALGFAERPLSQASRPELLAQAGLDFASLALAVTQELAGFAEELPRGVAPEVTA